MEAIGRNHSFETALADLVDNAIDAGSTQVFIRLVKANGRLCSLNLIENGRGMTTRLSRSDDGWWPAALYR